MTTDEKLHSAQYFDDLRDFWWNSDFIQLMGQRWQIDTVRSVLDVGCGQGHWGRVLLPILSPEAKLVGIDREPKWVEVAKEAAARLRVPQQLEYLVSTVETLPFADAAFDMVTCQTVIIHVRDPLTALREMLRVLKPGGLLALAEPNNAASSITLSSLSLNDSVDERLELVRFQLICERGKEQLGEGNNMRGDLLPYYLHQLGLNEIQSYIADLADYYLPPYATPREQAGVKCILSNIDEQVWVWDQADSKRYFLAGGGDKLSFEQLWTKAMRSNQLQKEALLEKQFCASGGALFYLTSVRKPFLRAALA